MSEGKKNLTAAVKFVTAFFMALLSAVIFCFFIPVHPLSDEKVNVYITYGSGIRAISRELKNAGVIRNRTVFRVYSIISGNTTNLKAGEYEFGYNENIAGIMERMVKGDVIKHPVTVTEGMDVSEIAAALASKNMADPVRFMALCRDAEFLKRNGFPKNNAEGFLFPDTYGFVKGETEERIIAAMYARFKQKVNLNIDENYVINGYKISGYGILKLASIIEKEAQLDSERPKVASVFYNRLKSEEAYLQRLESCATVRYAKNKKKGALLYKDLKFNSPYNTYIAIGLPPGPICNPGIESIEAAMAPADTKYRYFVVKADGGHTFSETLGQHNAAKQQYKDNK